VTIPIPADSANKSQLNSAVIFFVFNGSDINDLHFIEKDEGGHSPPYRNCVVDVVVDLRKALAFSSPSLAS
jgi:hypothetical protein